MLFKQHILDGIAAGRVTLAIRRWRRPTVKAGGTLHTPAGLLAIDEVCKVTLRALTDAHARTAGFASLDELHADIEAQREGQLYRIGFHIAGADPRIALRDNDAFSANQLAALLAKLARLDKAGAWTQATLQAIADHEGRRAGDLADMLGRDKNWLKLHIRKLKNLGLAESLGTGYRISPRGKVALNARGKAG